MDLEADAVGRLRWAAIVLAGITAVIHVVHPTYGGPALIVWANAGYLGDPRPVAFTAGGFALLACALLIYHDVARRAAYIAVALVAFAFLFGYGLWHTLLDHGAFWPTIASRGHSTEHPLVVVGEHLLADPVALASKVIEAALVVVGAVLFAADET